MNYTELFRDFLIQKRAKQKFENAFNNNKWHGRWKAKLRPKLSWKNDFLTQLMVNEFLTFPPYAFLSPTDIVWWQQVEGENEYWKKLNTEWNNYAVANSYLIDSQLRA